MQETGRAIDEKRTAPSRHGLGWRVVLALCVGGLVVLIASGFLMRTTIARIALQQVCKTYEIQCDCRIDRLTAQRVAISHLLIRHETGEDLAALDKAEVQLAWDGLFRVRPEKLVLSGLDATIDLAGDRAHLLKLRQLLSPPSADRDPPPQIDLSDIRLRLIAPQGEMELRADARILSRDDIDLQFVASPSSLAWSDHRIGLDSATGQLAFKAGVASADVDLRLNEFVTPEMQMGPARLALQTRREGDVAQLIGDVSVDALHQSQTLMQGVEAHFTGQARAPTSWLLTRRSLLGMIRTLDLNARADLAKTHGWSGADIGLTLALAEGEEGVATGPMSMHFKDLQSKRLTAENVRLEGQASLPQAASEPLVAIGDGEMRVEAGKLSDQTQLSRLEELLQQAPSPLRRASQSAFAEIAAMSQRFDAQVSLHAAMPSSGGVLVELTDQLEVFGGQGAKLSLKAQDETSLVRWRKGVWRVAADMRLDAGPGAMRLDGLNVESANRRGSLAKAELELDDASGAGRLLLKDAVWDMGDSPTFSVHSYRLDFTGQAYGADWTGLELRGALQGDMDESGWRVIAPGGIDVAVEEVFTGNTRLAAFSTKYQPSGALLTIDASPELGPGTLGRTASQLQIGERRYAVSFDKADIDWRAGQTPRLMLKLMDAGLAFSLSERPVHLRFPVTQAELVLDEHWRLTGATRAGSGDYGSIGLSGIATDFSLSGQDGGLDGALRALQVTVQDMASPLRFSASRFEGEARLDNGVVLSDGALVHDEGERSVRLALLSLRHDLSSGEGSAAVHSTLLPFSRDGIQPADLFPILRGLVANMEGPVTMTGAAQWGGGLGLRTQAALELTDISFATEKAGLFEGVFGRIELTDVINVRSDPGQTVVIHKWNPGVELKDGVVRFQLEGLKSVKLEEARLPYASGYVVAQPMTWRIHAPQNDITVAVQEVELGALLSGLGLKILSGEGRLSGVFPVRFTTGHVFLDAATLTANQGRIRYTGEAPARVTGDEETFLSLFLEAMEDLHYANLSLTLDGDVAGELDLNLQLTGHNPAVLDGYPFELNMDLAADLAALLNRAALSDDIINALRRSLAQRGTSQTGGAHETARAPPGE